jgi:hypothetical protein
MLLILTNPPKSLIQYEKSPVKNTLKKRIKTENQGVAMRNY